MCGPDLNTAERRRVPESISVTLHVSSYSLSKHQEAGSRPTQEFRPLAVAGTYRNIAVNTPTGIQECPELVQHTADLVSLQPIES